MRVTSLMGPGTDPHLYKASARDVDTTGSADIVFFTNGLFLEAQMEDILEQLANGKPSPVSAQIDRAFAALGQLRRRFDPHIWFDVRLWMQTVNRCATRWQASIHPHAADHQTNATAYLADLRRSTPHVREQAATVPEQQRVLVTAHVMRFNCFMPRS